MASYLPPRLVLAATLLSFSSVTAFADDARYFPANVHVVLSNDMTALLKSKTFQELKKSGPLATQAFEENLTNNLGIAATDVLRLTTAITYVNKKRPEQVVIATTARPVKAAEIADRKKGYVWQVNVRYEPSAIGAYTVYEQLFRLQLLPQDKPGPVDHGEAFCVVEKNVVIYGRLPVLKKILARKETPELSANMQAVLKQTGSTSAIVIAADLQDMPTSARKDLAVGLTFLPAPADLIGRVQTVGLKANETTEFKAEATLVCTEAGEVKKALATGLARLKPKLNDAGLSASAKERLKRIRTAIDAVNLSVNGDRLTARVAVEPIVAAQVFALLISPKQ